MLGMVGVVRELIEQLRIEGCGGSSAGENCAGIDSRVCSPIVVRLLVDVGVDVKSTVTVRLHCWP